MDLFLNILKWIFLIPVIFFVVTFGVYFFNLDMKLMALIEPILTKHYDRIKRDRHL